jgi:hypothetical protein
MSQDSSTLKASASTTSNQSMSSAAVSPAKMSVEPQVGKSADSSTDPVSGGSTPASSANSDPVGSLLRTFLISKISPLTKSSLTWKEQATPAGRPWLVLKPLVRRSKEKGSSFLPTTNRTTTLTYINALEKEWAGGRFHQTSRGRWRKQAKTGITGSMNWSQEMLVRTVVQKNPNLLPTPEAAEQFMGFPIGHTDLGR